MEWIMEPVSGFQGLTLLAADDCTGTGSTLNRCSCTGGLVVCQCSGGLKPPAEIKEG